MSVYAVTPLDVSDEVEALLVSAGLPVADIHDEGKILFFGITENNQLQGVIGIECYATVGLLRSLCVVSDARKAGHGARLVQWLEDWASNKGIKQVYLLTNDATAYFEKLHYHEIARTHVPAAIAQTTQFSSLCPSSATVMCKDLGL